LILKDIDGFSVYVEGTWCEISNGYEVVFSTSVTEGTTAEEVYARYKKTCSAITEQASVTK
jgi:hypothetical protein